jgi:SOS-response transcriptional repressor LexA
MTPRERDLVIAVNEHLEAHGVAPTYDELREALGYEHKSNIVRLLTSLRAQGIATWDPYKPRSIVIIADAISPIAINAASAPALKQALAQIAGVLAHREGGFETFEMMRNVADALLRPPRAA